jgi:putative transposase
MKERKALIDKKEALSICAQADLLGVDRSSFYYNSVGESQENLLLMREIDRLFLEHPTLGVLGLQDELKNIGLYYNVKRIRRLMRRMCLDPIYPKRNLSKLGIAKYIHPYLLRNLAIDRPNHVWAIDITYIPMKNGFMYLTVIIDVYSRFVVGWQLSNSMEKETQTALLHTAIARYGKPDIINSDQGAQYTCEHWNSTLKEYQIQISMDSKGRATDNVFVERFFRTLKQECIYLFPDKDGLELYKGIAIFMDRYNNHRSHQRIGRKKPKELYLPCAA